MIIQQDQIPDFSQNNFLAPLSFISGLNRTDTEKSVLYFDIETTGFSAQYTLCYLIGCVYWEDESWRYIQWFLDNPSEERQLLETFFDFAQRFRYLIHFNGEGFDLPYLKSRAALLGIEGGFDLFYDKIISIDLFHAAKSVKELLKLEHYKQKNLEQFLGIARTDRYSGKDMVAVYQSYIQAQPNVSQSNISQSDVSQSNISQSEALDILLLHNHDDIAALPLLTSLLSYTLLQAYQLDSIECRVNQTTDYGSTPVTELIVSAVLPAAVPIAVSYGKEPYYIKIDGNILKIRIRMYNGELKYFYTNYKDYYYLPNEDRALHKSVAFFVDKNFRTQSKAANCYSKKSGMFLPQPTELVTPHFKAEYHDKQSYFEADSAFFHDKNKLSAYINHILNFILPSYRKTAYQTHSQAPCD